MSFFDKNLIPKHIQDLSAYVPGRLTEDVIEELGLTSAIKLASNENNLGSSPKAIKAISLAVDKLARYGDADCRRLKEALAQKLKVSALNILAGNGSSEFILLLCHALLQPGQKAIMSRPSFTLYAKNAAAAGADALEIPVTPNYGHDLEAMIRKTNPGDLIFLDNPLNPTGAWLTPQELTSFLEKIPKSSLLVLDEAYADFCRLPRPDYHNFLSDGRVIILRTFSKIYGLAGLRSAYALMDKSISEALNKIRQPFNLNNLAQVGTLAALEDDEHLEKTLKMTWDCLDFFSEKLPALGLKVYPTQANFVMASLPNNFTADNVCNNLLKEGVIIRSLTSFGLPRHIRISVGLPEEIAILVKAMTTVLSS